MSGFRTQQSIWLANAGLQHARAALTYSKLHGVTGEHFDVIVVGAGIFGCTAAYLLKQSGKRVALLEARTVGSGVTSFSTAKLSAQQGPVYSTIAQKHGKMAAKSYYEMNVHGISMVEDLVQRLNLDCEFEHRAHATWTSDESKMSTIRKEYETCVDIGIDCKLVESEELCLELPPSINPKLAVWFDKQAQFNAYKYCAELCKHIHGDGSVVYEETRVTAVSHNTPHQVEIAANQSKLTGDNVVLATHLPILDRSMHFAMLEPSRTLCIAVRVDREKQANKLHNMFISIDTPMRSLRTTDNDDVVVVSGESFKQGDETDTGKFYDNLEVWAKENFHVTEVLAYWSAMDYFSGDHIPFMGYLHRGTNSLFTATGFSKWGLANSVAGAELVTDLIHGRSNPYHNLVDARRWDLISQWKEMTMENWHTGKHFIMDKIKHLLAPGKIEALKPGEGAVVKVAGETVGAYLDDEGKYHMVTPVCTHLGCDLVFNQGDRVWDCPCHGSRFDVDGEVLHGPACKPLCQRNDLQW